MGEVTGADQRHVLPSTHDNGTPRSQFNPDPSPLRYNVLPKPTSSLTSIVVTAPEGIAVAGPGVLTDGFGAAFAAVLLNFIFSSDFSGSYGKTARAAPPRTRP